LALAVPLSRFTPRVGGGSAFFVRRHCYMSTNKIVQIKTVAGGTQADPHFAILANLDIYDADTVDVFLREVVKIFNTHRMCSPPETDGLLLTIIGDCSAIRCAELWRQLMGEDKALLFFMSLMRVADVIRGSESGVELEKVSIIEGYVFPEDYLKLRKDDFVRHGPNNLARSGAIMPLFKRIFGKK